MAQINIHRLSGRLAYSQASTFLHFLGTSYLGIPFQPTFIKVLKKGFGLWGTNYGSSRKGNISLSVYQEAESFFAKWVGVEDCVTVSSGFLAAQAIVHWTASKNRTVFKVNGDHPALWFEGKIVSQMNSQKNISVDSSLLIRQINSQKGESCIIMGTSVNPLTGFIYDYSWVRELKKLVILVVDDSHGFGVLGFGGKGVIKSIPYNPMVNVIIISSLGKALGIPGGIILGNAEIVDEIRSSPLFLSSSPVSPAFLYAFLNCQEIYSTGREKLFENLGTLKNLLPKEIIVSGLHPVISIPLNLDNRNTHVESLNNYLIRKGILISSFPYPTVEDVPVTRIVINACHKLNDLKKLALSIDKWILEQNT